MPPASYLQDAESRNTDSFALLEMPRDHEIAKQGFTCLFRQLMLLGQDRGKTLECNWTPGFDAVVGVFALTAGAMMIFLRRARNALRN